MRTIIAFCGAAGAGKDEAASVLIERYGFVKRSFAEPLRAEVWRTMTDPDYCDLVWHEMPQVCRDALLDCMAMNDRDPWRKPLSADMRRLLQAWGTEFRRSQDPDYWTTLNEQSLPKSGLFVFTDVRFPNEAEMIKRVGGSLFRIERESIKTNGHISESYWPKFEYVAAIPNNGTREDFHAAVLDVMGLYLGEG